MRIATLFLLLSATSLYADEWTPPEAPDPHAILQEARADTRAKRYETALAKHVWFHEHALEIDPAFYGVRLSFALSYWMELAEQYPPALTKLEELRDAAEQNVLAGKRVRESFHDVASINAELGKQAATRKLFERLDEKDSKAAKQVFPLAQPSLIEGKAYALVGKYVSPDDDFAKMKERYQMHQKMARNAQFGARHLNFANKKLANEATTLVAILARTDRKEKAEEIAASARALWDDESFHADLEKALTGVVPDPWP